MWEQLRADHSPNCVSLGELLKHSNSEFPHLHTRMIVSSHRAAVGRTTWCIPSAQRTASVSAWRGCSKPTLETSTCPHHHHGHQQDCLFTDVVSKANKELAPYSTVSYYQSWDYPTSCLYHLCTYCPRVDDIYFQFRHFSNKNTSLRILEWAATVEQIGG